MKRTGWIVVSALISLVTIGRAQLTGTPSCTSAAARLRRAGVMRLIVPSWSSAPQRPQLLRLEIILITSLVVRVVVATESSWRAIRAPASPAPPISFNAAPGTRWGAFGGSGDRSPRCSSEELERDGLALHPESQVRHENQIGVRPAGEQAVAVAADDRGGVLLLERVPAQRGRRVLQEPRPESVVGFEGEETAVEPVGGRRRESIVELLRHTGHSTTALP